MKHDNEIEVSVCLCTYKRPEKLAQCLESLLNQVFAQTFEVIVTDNDYKRSGEHVVEQFKTPFQNKGISLLYLVEPVQNIALARNRSLKPARGDLVAFIDDDEYAAENWLEKLLHTLENKNVDAVFGPVLSMVPETFPSWMKESRLFVSSHLPTGTNLSGSQCKTNNALIKRSVLAIRPGPFLKKFGKTGGEDTDLFNWLERQGHFLCWCDEAVVYESLEEKRRKWSWHLQRGYRGGWGFSCQKVQVMGWARGFLYALFQAFLGLLKATYKFGGGCYYNPRAALLDFLRDAAGQAGKIGYFLGIRIEEYKE